MKQILFSLITFVWLYSCSNSTEQTVAAAQIPQQEKEMQDAITKYPDSLLLREKMVQYYQNNGTNDLAIAELNKIISIDSSDAALWDKKAELYLLEEDTAASIKSYVKAIELFADPQYIMSVGLLYAFTKNETALVMADALLIGKNAKADKEANLIKGIYYNVTNNKQKAIGYFDACIKANYTYIPAYLQKGILLFDLGKYAEAIAVLERAVTLQNDFSEGYYWLGQSYEKLKKTDLAVENYRTAIFYDQDYTDAKEALAKLGIKN